MAERGLEAARYSAAEILRNGQAILVRALKPEDKEGLIGAASSLTLQSLRRRFFQTKTRFTEAEQRFFLNPDFVTHVALVAVAEEAGRPLIVGGARYVVDKPGGAELAFAVADRYQGLGMGTALMRHLTAIAREAGLRELTAQVLPENLPMLTVLKKSGLSYSTKLESGTVCITLRLN